MADVADTFEGLNVMDSSQFKIWLLGHLGRQYNSDSRTRYSAFDFRHLDVPQGDSHLDSFLYLVKKLNPTAREAVKKAITELIVESKPDTLPMGAMRDLLIWVSGLKIREALETFPSIFGDETWGGVGLYDALSVMLSFTDRPQEAYLALREKYYQRALHGSTAETEDDVKRMKAAGAKIIIRRDNEFEVYVYVKDPRLVRNIKKGEQWSSGWDYDASGYATYIYTRLNELQVVEHVDGDNLSVP